MDKITDHLNENKLLVYTVATMYRWFIDIFEKLNKDTSLLMFSLTLQFRKNIELCIDRSERNHQLLIGVSHYQFL